MVSIRQSLAELDAAYRFRTVALECYRSAVQSAGQYAVEVDVDLTESHRRELESLAVRIAESLGEQSLQQIGAEVRSALRHFRDRANEVLEHLRQDLAEKATSLQKIFESMADSDGDHEVRIGKTIRALRDLAAKPEAAAVRGPLSDAAASLNESLEEMKRQHQFTVAQFPTEIQMLHQRIQTLESLAARDHGGDLSARSELESRLVPAIASGEPFFLLLLRVRNLAAVRRQYPDVEEILLDAFSKRLRNCLKPEDCAARWNEDRVAVLAAGNKSDSIAAVRRVAEHVGGTYVIRLGERLVRPVLQVNVAAVDGRTDETPQRLMGRLESLYEAMA